MHELELSIHNATGGTTVVPLTPGRFRIGKSQECDIVIQDRHASRYHADVVVGADGSVALHDAGSTNGIVKDRQVVRDSVALKIGDTARIGRTEICLLPAGEKVTPPTVAVPRLVSDAATPDAPPVAKAPPPRPPEQPAVSQALLDFKSRVHTEVLDYLGLHKRGEIHKMSTDELRVEATRAAREIIDQKKWSFPDGTSEHLVIEEIVAEAIGLGPLEPLLADDAITEVMVNGPDQLYVERGGRLTRENARFHDDKSLMAIIERVVTPLGRRIDEGSPMVDARLPDGSRVNAIIPPLALNGPTVTIRKFARRQLTMDDLVRYGTLTPEMAEFLEVCVAHRRNIVVSGGTGSGKTTTLNILSNFIPEAERIVTIEDAAELQLAQTHVVSLESRPANVEGKGAVAIRDLVKNALRMRPDRIVVGECRGGEAIDMLQAMNTGHDGSMTTGHANSPRDLLARLEVMVLMAGFELPVRAIREQVASAVDIILQQTRFADGTRRVTSIVEVDGMEGDVILLQPVFEYAREGEDATGKVTGVFKGCGYAPRFYNDLAKAGFNLNTSVFNLGNEPVDGPEWEERA
ncbi:MAG: ATPase, T2SS/T4P/T4SS family [Pseudomonadota bacterium]